MHLDKPDPFHPASDPAAYVPRPAFERALRELELCLRGGSLVAALLGPPGIGKTLLLRVLAERLEEDFKVVYLPYPHTAARELCRWALIELGEKPGTDAEGALLQVAARYGGPGGLEEDREALVLLLDDADALPLVSARRLYELARDGAGRLRLVLAGADAQRLERTLGMMADDLPVLRLDEPMSAEETSEYVLSRLELVEADSVTRALFSEETLSALHELSAGIPAVLHEHAMAVLTGQGLSDAMLPPAPPETSWEAVVVEAERERREVVPAPPAVESAPTAAAAPRPRASTLLRGVEEAEARAAAARRPRSDRRIGRWLAAALVLAVVVVLGRAVPPWLGARLARSSAPPPAVEPERPAPAPAQAPVPPEQPMPVVEIPLPQEPVPEASVPLEAETPRPAEAEPPAPEAPEAAAAAPAPAPVDEFAPIADALAPLREELARRGALPPPPAPKPQLAPGEPGSTVAGSRIAVSVTAPEGAVIEIEGRRAGTAPLEGVSLSPGTYRFVARLPDGRVMQRTVAVAEGSGEVVFP